MCTQRRAVFAKRIIYVGPCMPLLHVDLSISGSVFKSTCFVFAQRLYIGRCALSAVTSLLDRIQRYSIIGDHVDTNSFCRIE